MNLYILLVLNFKIDYMFLFSQGNTPVFNDNKAMQC